MKTSLLAVLLCCAALFGWTCCAGSDAPGGEVDAPVHAAAPSPAPLETIPVQPLRVALPAGPTGPADANGVGKIAPPPVPMVLLAEVPPPPAARLDAEHLARRYFHAKVGAEELEQLLPSDLETHLRTRERLPGLFALIDERDRLERDLSILGPPGADEKLPALDLSARSDGDFGRIYGNWPREDLLLENWRITRYAYAESQRLLSEAAQLGAVHDDRQPAPALGAFG